MTSSSPSFAASWSAEWIDLNLDDGRNILPPRSGHVSFVLDDTVYIFGGYAADDEGGTVSPPKQYPTNDLWRLEARNGKLAWTKVQTPVSSKLPQARLVAASAACPIDNSRNPAGIVLGGWDSDETARNGGSGGILQDVCVYFENNHSHQEGDDEEVTMDGGRWKELPIDLQQPTSRLCALSLVENKESASLVSRVWIHNHRCTDHVLLLEFDLHQSSDEIKPRLVKQPVTGSIPSSRGLHACVQLPSTSRILLFGGAAQDGSMSNEVFCLDTETWVWQEAKRDMDDPQPCPRAAPCLVALDDHTCLLFGGASRSSEGGLHGCNDVWVLELLDVESGSPRAKWTQLAGDGGTGPPGRNAATLVPLEGSDYFEVMRGLDGFRDESARYFLLTGGWYPFRQTYRDNFVLRVTAQRK